MHFAIRDFKLHAVRYNMASKIMSTVFVNREADEHVFYTVFVVYEAGLVFSVFLPVRSSCWVTEAAASTASAASNTGLFNTQHQGRARPQHTRASRVKCRARDGETRANSTSLAPLSFHWMWNCWNQSWFCLFLPASNFRVFFWNSDDQRKTKQAFTTLFLAEHAISVNSWQFFFLSQWV